MTDISESKEKRSSLTRITAGLDEFDYKVINQMARARSLSLSEAVRTVIHRWIELNPEILEKNYGISFKEITEEIQRESYEISLDKTLKPYEKEIIDELPEFFEIVENVSIEDVSDYFNVDNKVIKRIIFTHGKELKNRGLNLKLKNNIIYNRG
ncbi:MAG: hypothetical protein ACTSRI_19675 [Promethearchaeota archaeon]